VRRHKPDKLTRRYYLGFLPESRKMPQIARNEVVGTRRIGTFQEPIVIGIARHFKTSRRYDQSTGLAGDLSPFYLPLAAAVSDFGLHRRDRHSTAFAQTPCEYLCAVRALYQPDRQPLGKRREALD
jgi:hypothetical protein